MLDIRETGNDQPLLPQKHWRQQGLLLSQVDVLTWIPAHSVLVLHCGGYTGTAGRGRSWGSPGGPLDVVCHPFARSALAVRGASLLLPVWLLLGHG